MNVGAKLKPAVEKEKRNKYFILGIRGKLKVC